MILIQVNLEMKWSIQSEVPPNRNDQISLGKRGIGDNFYCKTTTKSNPQALVKIFSSINTYKRKTSFFPTPIPKSMLSIPLQGFNLISVPGIITQHFHKFQ